MCCSDMRNNDLEKIYDRPFVSDNSRNRVLLCPGFMVPKQEGSIPHQDETLCPGYQDSISRTEVVHSSKVSTGQFHYLMFHLGPQSAVNIIRDWIHLF